MSVDIEKPGKIDNKLSKSDKEIVELKEGNTGKIDILKKDKNMTKFKEKKQRCYHCNKKLKLMNFECRCKNRFCSNCKAAETHKCPIDYKKLGREELERNLGGGKFSKLDRI